MPEHTGNSGPTIFNPSSFHYEQIRGGWHFLSLGKPSVSHREHRVTLVTSKRLEAQALVCLAFPSSSSQSLPCLSLTRLTVNKRHLRRLPWLAIQASCKNHQFDKKLSITYITYILSFRFCRTHNVSAPNDLDISNLKTSSPSDFSNPRSATWNNQISTKNLLSFPILKSFTSSILIQRSAFLFWRARHLISTDVLSCRFHWTNSIPHP